MKSLSVNLSKNSYSILIGNNIINNINEYIKNVFNGKKIFIITDNIVNELYGHKIKDILSKDYDVNLFSFEEGEKNKNLNTVMKVYDNLLNNNITRSDLIIALGGGVVGDLSGFVSSTILRGVKFVQIPTTLLSQVDSSVGGKVGIDTEQGKNLVGSFYNPELVIIDVNMLNSLPDKIFNDALGEVIKYGLIYDENLFVKLENYEDITYLKSDIIDIIYTCVSIKKEIVERDEFDKNERMILNFGHTIGHAIEKISDYKLNHGECVAIGMSLITEISENKGLTQKGTTDRIKNVLKKYNLKSDILLDDKKSIIDAINLDKKNMDGKLNLILLEHIGSAFIYKTDISFLDDLLIGNKQ